MKHFKFTAKATLMGLALATAWGAAAIAEQARFAWYASTVHPYFDEVQTGVDAFSDKTGIEVVKRLGQDWTQDNQNENVSAMAAQGFTHFSIFPSDVAGAQGLYEELAERGVTIVDFGQATQDPTPASFYVGTQAKEAAMQATEALIEAMGGSGNIINILEVPGENTRLRDEGVQEVVARYPDVQIIQTVGDLATIEGSVEKVQNAIAANLVIVVACVRLLLILEFVVSTISAARRFSLRSPASIEPATRVPVSATRAAMIC